MIRPHGSGGRAAAMRVKLENAESAADLMSALEERVDAVVTMTGPDELEVSLLGSRAVAADVEELQRRIDEWGPGRAVVLSDL